MLSGIIREGLNRGWRETVLNTVETKVDLTVWIGMVIAIRPASWPVYYICKDNGDAGGMDLGGTIALNSPNVPRLVGADTVEYVKITSQRPWIWLRGVNNSVVTFMTTESSKNYDV